MSKYRLQSGQAGERMGNRTPNRQCDVCGNKFYGRPKDIKNGYAKYCSRKCWEFAHRVECVCRYCGQSFSVIKGDIAKDRGKYCSHNCSHAALRGVNSPSYIHGNCVDGKRPSEATKARNILNRAIKKGLVVRLPCAVCDDPNSHGHHDDYSKPLEVKWLCVQHHIGGIHSKERACHK